MKAAKIWAILLLMVVSKDLSSQTLPADRQEYFEHLIQELFPVQDEDLPYEDFYEALFQYYMQPLDLNQASQEELQALFILSEAQIQSFFQHLRRSGKLLSIYELQAIPGWDLQTIYQLLPFVQVQDVGFRKNNRPLLSRIKELGQGMVLIRQERILEERQGYKPRNDTLPPPYLGSPDKIYVRFRMNRAHDFSFGLTLEKDAGEALSWKPAEKRYGADFISFHAALFNQGKFSKVVIGDFQLQFGQSLVFGSGFSIGKGAETILSVRRSNIGIRPYTSALEFGFFRGAAFTIQLRPQLEVTTLYANNGRDAVVEVPADLDSLALVPYFSSLQQTGFHRTTRELSGKGSIREQSAGAVIHYKSKNRRLQLGATSLFTHFSQEWNRNPRLYNQFEFRGKKNYAGSLFGEYTWQNIHLFTEFARSKSGGTGLLAGTIIALSPQLDFSFLYRNYQRHFHSFYSTGFGEGSRSINEQGVYFGLKFKPNRQWWFTSYFDRFSFPWLRYRVDAPSDGYEYLLRATYQPIKRLSLYSQFREEKKDINSPGRNVNNIPLPGRKRNYQINLDFVATDKISIRSRVQWSSYHLNEQKTKGFVLVQDASWQYQRLRISGRMALFDTDDYNNRQYVYEKDVLWAFSIPTYYGKGIRNYLLLQYKLSKQITVWLRWSRTRYIDREVISSGMEKIQGSQINQLKAQVRWMFK